MSVGKRTERIISFPPDIKILKFQAYWFRDDETVPSFVRCYPSRFFPASSRISKMW